MLSQRAASCASALFRASEAGALCQASRLFSNAAPSNSGAADAKKEKKSSGNAPTYTYMSPGSSLKEPTYGVSISDPDVHYYDKPVSSGQYYTFNVTNPSRQQHTIVFNSKPKQARYTISLSDPVYKTENDAKDVTPKPK